MQKWQFQSVIGHRPPCGMDAWTVAQTEELRAASPSCRLDVLRGLAFRGIPLRFFLARPSCLSRVRAAPRLPTHFGRRRRRAGGTGLCSSGDCLRSSSGCLRSRLHYLRCGSSVGRRGHLHPLDHAPLALPRIGLGTQLAHRCLSSLSKASVPMPMPACTSAFLPDTSA